MTKFTLSSRASYQEVYDIYQEANKEGEDQEKHKQYLAKSLAENL